MSSNRSGPSARSDAWLAGALFAVFAGMTTAAFRYPPVPRAFPLIVGGAGTLLSAIQFVRLLLIARTSPPVVVGESSRQRVVMFLWFSAAIASVFVAGVVVGSALFVGAFLRVRERESLRFAVPSAVVVGVGLHVVLERIFGLPLFKGIIWP